MAGITPLKAIRAKCLDCSNDQRKEVKECPITKCPIWLYRMGKRPTVDESVNKGEFTEKSRDS